MRLNPMKMLSSKSPDVEPVLLAVTPPRTGERTLLGVENMLSSIAVPEPFSLELASEAHGVTLMARCLSDQVVRTQVAALYPQARIREVEPDDDPLRLRDGEQAWEMTLRSSGPEHVPLRVFRDGDLLDPGSDPLIALLGALSDLGEGERVVARLLLRSLGPQWSLHHSEMVHSVPSPRAVATPSSHAAGTSRGPGLGMVVLGVVALAAYQGYNWAQSGELWKTVLMGLAATVLLGVGGWAWGRWKTSRSRVFDPMLIREKVSRIAFDAEIRVAAILPKGTGQQRAEELLERVAAAYHHYDNPAGARFRVGKALPRNPTTDLHPSGAGLFGARSVVGVREAACLWHPPGEGNETALVARTGSRVLLPSAHSVGEGAYVGDTTSGSPSRVHFPVDLLQRHHLYVARTRMGKSTLMHHIVVHKMAQKAAGMDDGAIVVIDPHADLLEGLLEHVPESLVDKVRLIDLADERGSPGINLLDTRVFADRDRTADSVVRVAKGTVGAVGTEDAVDPGADRKKPARGQREEGGGGTVHDPRWFENPH